MKNITQIDTTTAYEKSVTTQENNQDKTTNPDKQQSQHSVLDNIIVMHKLISLNILKECTGLSRSTIYSLLDPKSKHYDDTFPKQVQITANRVGCVAVEVNAWIEERIKARSLINTSREFIKM